MLSKLFQPRVNAPGFKAETMKSELFKGAAEAGRDKAIRVTAAEELEGK